MSIRIEKNTHTNSISFQQTRWVSIILSRYIRKSKTENTAFTLSLPGQYIRLPNIKMQRNANSNQCPTADCLHADMVD